jgi:tetratricopeptide (TPR) repeat protein
MSHTSLMREGRVATLFLFYDFVKSSRSATLQKNPERAPAPHGSDLRAGRALATTFAAIWIGCAATTPPPASAPASSATFSGFADSLEGAADAARARRWHTAYQIYARHYLRNPKVFDASPDLYAAFVEVCFETSLYRPAVALSKRFAALRPQDPRVGIFVRALALNRQHQEAISWADRYLAAGVGSRPDLLYWRAKAYFALGRYGKAVRSFQAANTPSDGGANEYWLAESLRRQGRYPEARALAERAARASNAPHVTALLSELVRAERTGLDVRVIKPQAVELSIYHLLTDDGTGPYGSLVTLQIANLRPDSSEVRVDVDLPGFGQSVTRQVTLVGHGGGTPRTTSVYATPQLDRAAAISLGERTKKMLRVRVTRLGDGQVVLEESWRVPVLPRDYIAYSRQSRQDPEKLVRDDNGFGVLITPRARWVDQALSYAKAFHPKRELPGPFADSVQQVRAIYDYLKSIGVTYAIGSPTLYRQKGEPMLQRIRPPGTVLQLRAAQCWEGTNVFAAMLEALKLEPILFRVPGHILVGWKKTRYDALPGAAGTPYYLLETTLIGSSDFDKALKAGSSRLLREYRAGNLRNGLARIIPVARLRTRGIVAQPWDD